MPPPAVLAPLRAVVNKMAVAEAAGAEAAGPRRVAHRRVGRRPATVAAEAEVVEAEAAVEAEATNYNNLKKIQMERVAFCSNGYA